MISVLVVLAAACIGAAAQAPDIEIEKAFELLMQKAAPPKNADEAKSKAAGDEFSAALKGFADAWAPRAAELGEGRRTLARALLLAGRRTEAVHHLEHFVATRGGSPEIEEALMDLGAAYLDVGEIEKSRALYEKFLVDRPTSDRARAARFYLGVAHVQAGRIDEGVAALDVVGKSEADHPLTGEARLMAATVLAESGRVEEARARVALMLAEAPEAEALVQLRKDLDRIGTAAPELKGVRTWLDGAPLLLEASKGKVVVLCFFADFYEACRSEMEFLNRAALKHEGKPVVFVGLTTYYRGKTIDADAEDALVRAFAKEKAPAMKIGVAADFSLLKAYGVRGVPHVVVVDREGKIAHQKTGGSRFEKRGLAALEAAVERALK